MSTCSNEAIIAANEIKQFMDKLSNDVGVRLHDQIGKSLSEE